MQFEPQGNTCRLRGRLSQQDVKQLWPERHSLVADNIQQLDLSELEYVDSAGMAFLMELLSQSNGMLVLKAPSEQVKKLVSLYDLETFFTE
ncbi:STAS domain-containing protein [Shewanella avicenniae]|uniref:STAS domain-containing protein n=1 Tax=Shewanella avicenniae TaxID=2814294 RepID=A0ABX7QRN3_9GAMM|nr:STAS domain-containing protein [Shewanella avicenniae]QSX34111.1 STAS domain-containing protein [Shewanella avicenniae]